MFWCIVPIVDTTPDFVMSLSPCCVSPELDWKFGDGVGVYRCTTNGLLLTIETFIGDTAILDLVDSSFGNLVFSISPISLTNLCCSFYISFSNYACSFAWFGE